MPTLLPPLPVGGITDNTINFGALQNPSQTSGDGLPALPALSTLPALSSLGDTVSSAVIPASNPSNTIVQKDGIIAKVAYLVLGVVIIAGAIWVYRR